jgi:hypothetical protein
LVGKRAPFHRFLGNIAQIAKNKRWYLTELKTIYAEEKDSFPYLKAIHLTVDVPLRKGLKPIFMHNSRLYDSLNGQYWGEYWIETLDPCHRQLTPYYDNWRNQLKTKDNMPPFFL